MDRFTAAINNPVFIGLLLIVLGLVCYFVNAAIHDGDLAKAGGTISAAGLAYLGGAGHANANNGGKV